MSSPPKNVIKHNYLIWDPMTNCLWCLSLVIAWIKTSVKWINLNEMWWKWGEGGMWSTKCPIFNLFKLFSPYISIIHLFIDLFLCFHCLRSFIKAGPILPLSFFPAFLASLPFPEPWHTLLTGWFKGEHYSAGDEIISFLSSTALFPLLMGSPAASEARGGETCPA